MTARTTLASALASSKVFTDGDWVESKDQNPGGDVRLIQLADIGDGTFTSKSSRFMTVDKARELRCTFLESGDVLVARMPDPLGRACVFPGDSRPSVTVVDVCIIRPNPNEIDPTWLVHFLNSPVARRQVESFATGTTRARISRSNLSKIKICVPPLPDQRRIAAILDQADALRAKRRAAIVQLDTLAQSIFLDMVGDPSENPKGLQTAPLSALCIRITDGTHQPPNWSNVGVPFLFVSNIVSGEISFDTKKLISEDTHRELTRRCPIEVGDVLYTIVGSYGVPAVVTSPRKFAFQRHIAHLKPDPKLLDPQFLREMLASPPLRRQADRAARGVAQKTINLADIKNFTVFCPPMPMQLAFSARISVIEQTKSKYVCSLAQLDALFASLQYRAFRGEL